jgi:hypothetical protein
MIALCVLGFREGEIQVWETAAWRLRVLEHE